MILKPEQINRFIELHKDYVGFESYSEKQNFSDEELENITGLCTILQNIRARLIYEGYSIEELRKKALSMY